VRPFQRKSSRRISEFRIMEIAEADAEKVAKDNRVRWKPKTSDSITLFTRT
jgi:hypothetical protein